MPRVANKLTPTKSGGFVARKRIPADVQVEYRRLFGLAWEERLNTGAEVPVSLARAKEREWRTEIENRIQNIRAERKGVGRSLTPQQARGLAGAWYHWFTNRHLAKYRPASHWREYLSEVSERVSDAVLPPKGLDGCADEEWERSPKARERLRPLLADWGETSLFLASQGVTLDQLSRDLFLDYLYSDFAAALRLLIRRAEGNYSPDDRPREFPKFAHTPDPGLTPWMLFERWIAEVKPATSTVDRWRAVFLQLGKDFPTQNATSLTNEQARAWLNGLINQGRTAGTVQGTWQNAAKTIWGWALEQRFVPENPFLGIRLPRQRRTSMRESKAFHADEATTILSASLEFNDAGRKSAAAKRWIPWLCAYTGARSGEIAQLRGSDVIERDGIRAVRITPEAGTVKSRQTRLVPLHEHLIEQGFLSFVNKSGKGPLFYNKRDKAHDSDDPTNPRKPRYVKARELVAAWVRELGVNDSELQPNHAWRHTFKQVAERNGISERISDAITGHAPHTVGRAYGAPTLSDMAEALRKFPRYL